MTRRRDLRGPLLQEERTRAILEAQPEAFAAFGLSLGLAVAAIAGVAYGVFCLLALVRP